MTEQKSYSLEKFAEALDAMGEMPDIRIDQVVVSRSFEYVEILEHHRGRKAGFKQAAKMLRGTPMSLYTTYPDHFPNPKEVTDEH